MGPGFLPLAAAMAAAHLEAQGHMETIQPYLDYFSANPEWALVIIFLIAFGEALLIIGLFVPSTAVLIGAGMLVGTGHLEFWPVFWATAVGCILGDQVSYWAGRMFGDRLKQLWPLNRYPTLVARGEDFVARHGGKSIAIGRFIPGIKAVIPGVVGMLGMNQLFFVAVNISSGLFWAAAHVLPGVLLGQGLAMAGELSGRLAIVILVLIVVIGVLGWLTRMIAAALLSPVLRRFLHAISLRLRAMDSRAFHRLGRRMAPDHPLSGRLLSFGLLGFLCLGLLINLLFGVWHRAVPSNLDLSVKSLMTELRNAPADDLMVAITMLGDWWVLLAMLAAMAAWLVWKRALAIAAGLLTVVVAQLVFTIGMKAIVGRQRPPGLDTTTFDTFGSFPSGYAALATLAFGALAVIAGHSLGRWSRASLISLSCTVIGAIAFSRLYLGAHWLSDVVGGIMLAVILVMALAFAIEAFPARRLQPLRFIGISLLALVVAWSVDVTINHDTKAARYAKLRPVEEFTLAQWRGGGWMTAPNRRVDLAGQPEDVFVAQWAGSLPGLQAAAQRAGFTVQPEWNWARALTYFDPHAPFDVVPPRPLLHEGLQAKLTAVRKDEESPLQRFVLRAYRSDDAVVTDQGLVPVFLVSLLREKHRPQFELYTMPQLGPVPDAMREGLLAQLRIGGEELVAASALGTETPRAVILAHP